jgi:hypothetical protein
VNGKYWLSLFLCISLFFNGGCIHPSAIEDKSLNLSGTDKTPESRVAHSTLQIESIVYSQTKWPLTDFFERLMDGEFRDSIAKVDLRYTPSNTQNEILRELIDDGFIPVFVNIKNTSSIPIKISESQFYLESDSSHIPAIAADRVPRMFKRFSPEAVAASVYNVGVVVVTSAVLLAALVAIAKDNNGFNQMYFGDMPALSGPQNSTVINDPEKTTKINYRNYLISKREIPPYSEVQGLLFFFNSAKRDSRVLHLGFEDADAKAETKSVSSERSPPTDN